MTRFEVSKTVVPPPLYLLQTGYWLRFDSQEGTFWLRSGCVINLINVKTPSCVTTSLEIQRHHLPLTGITLSMNTPGYERQAASSDNATRFYHHDCNVATCTTAARANAGLL
jgi:hypothetical protein